MSPYLGRKHGTPTSLVVLVTLLSVDTIPAESRPFPCVQQAHLLSSEDQVQVHFPLWGKQATAARRLRPGVGMEVRAMLRAFVFQL